MCNNKHDNNINSNFFKYEEWSVTIGRSIYVLDTGPIVQYFCQRPLSLGHYVYLSLAGFLTVLFLPQRALTTPTARRISLPSVGSERLAPVCRREPPPQWDNTCTGVMCCLPARLIFEPGLTSVCTWFSCWQLIFTLIGIEWWKTVVPLTKLHDPIISIQLKDHPLTRTQREIILYIANGFWHISLCSVLCQEHWMSITECNS